MVPGQRNRLNLVFNSTWFRRQAATPLGIKETSSSHLFQCLYWSFAGTCSTLISLQIFQIAMSKNPSSFTMFIFFLEIGRIFIKKTTFIGVQLIYNAVLISVVQQSEPVIHIHVSILFRCFSYMGHYRVLSSFLCYMVGLYQLFTFYIKVCICNPSLPIYSISLPQLIIMF